MFRCSLLAFSVIIIERPITSHTLSNTYANHFLNKNKISNLMLSPARARSVEFPRQKIYLSNLNQLMDKKVILQPEIEVNNKLFPQRDFARRLSTSHQRAKSSIQLRSQRFDLHWTSKRAKNMLVENSKQAVVVQSNRVKLQLPRTKSTQLPNNGSAHFKDESIKFYSTCSGLPFNSSPESRQQQNPSKPASPQKNFLRRGSNIQKQIVINLLRNKLLRQQEINQKKDYSNSEIIKMIQVFKGVALDQYSRKGLLTKDRENCEKRRELQLRGWENEPFHDYQLQDQKQ